MHEKINNLHTLNNPSVFKITLNSSGWATAPVSADSAQVLKQPQAGF